MQTRPYTIALLLNVVFLHPSPIESGRILGIFIVESKSHHSINQPIVKGLAAKGHEVIMISHFKSNDSTPNYEEILLPGGHENYIDSIAIEECSGNYVRVGDVLEMVRILESSFCDTVLNMEFVKQLINSKGKKIDLIIAEIYFTQCYHLLAYKLNVPLVTVMPVSTAKGIDNFIGNVGGSFVITSKMNFWKRLEYTWYNVWTYLHHIYVSNKDMKRYSKEIFNMELPPDEELNKKTAVAFYNNHFSFICRSLSPNAIDIAGIHIKESKKLPKDVDDFIEGADHGVIFFSFGSTIKASSITPEKLKIIKDTFSSIPQRVLWRVNELNVTDLPSNVKVAKWFPQRDILEHKNVIAFITHCGLLGSLEAIHTATPVIAIPFAFDQFDNAYILTMENEVGIYVDYYTMDKDSLVDAINEVITNTKYRENVQRLSKIFRDRPMSPLNESLYWIEHVLRHNGAPHLRTVAADMPSYQYLLLDVIVFVLGIVLGTAYFCTVFIKVIIWMLRYCQNPITKKIQ